MFYSLWVKLGIVVAVLAVIAGGYLYVDNLGKRAAEAEAAKVLLAEQLKSAVADKVRLEKEIENAKRFTEILNTELQAARAERQAYVAIFARHDLEKIAIEKPGLLTARMQSATERLWRTFEQVLSGPAGVDKPVSEAAAGGRDVPAPGEASR